MHNLKTRWLEALRSGDYSQGQGMLHDSKESYCCLGVLCDLIDPYAWGEGTIWHGQDTYPELFPLDVRINALFIEQALGRLNDEEGVTFTEIADIIEHNIPEEVFGRLRLPE